MNLKRLQYILIVAMIAMILHTVEEYVTKLWNFDPFMIYMSNHFSISGVSIYFTVQVFVLLLTIGVLVLAINNKFSKLLAILLGLVFLLELLHPYNAIRILGYYSGLYTGMALVIIGYLYWKEIFNQLTNEKNRL